LVLNNSSENSNNIDNNIQNKNKQNNINIFEKEDNIEINKNEKHQFLNNKRRKFDTINDHLLLCGLKNHGKK
jgi:hypothetical protein